MSLAQRKRSSHPVASTVMIVNTSMHATNSSSHPGSRSLKINGSAGVVAFGVVGAEVGDFVGCAPGRLSEEVEFGGGFHSKSCRVHVIMSDMSMIAIINARNR